MLARPQLSDGGINRALLAGDTIVTGEIFPAAIATTAITITGTQLQSGWINRTGLAAPGTDTIDSAANLIAAISQGLGLSGVQDGTAFRLSWYNPSASAITVAAAANTGVTVSAGTVNAGSVKDFLVTIVDGTPARTFNGIATNASAVITGVSQADVAALGVGQIVTNAVVGLQGQTIIGLDISKGTVTLSGNANASQAVSISASPVVTLQGLGQKLV